MTADELTPETRAALVAILRRAAHRGREIRGKNGTAVAGDPGQETAPTASSNDRYGRRQVHGTLQDGPTNRESLTGHSEGSASPEADAGGGQ